MTTPRENVKLTVMVLPEAIDALAESAGQLGLSQTDAVNRAFVHLRDSLKVWPMDWVRFFLVSMGISHLILDLLLFGYFQLPAMFGWLKGAGVPLIVTAVTFVIGLLFGFRLIRRRP